MLADIAGQEVIVDLGAVAAGLLSVGALFAAATALLRRVLRHVLAAELKPLLDQMQPNGGSTMRDALDRVEARLDEGAQRMAKLEAGVAALAPVLADFRRSHPEIRDDLDDDTGQS